MAKIRVAVVGAGGIGGTHLRAYADWPEMCEIVGIADIHLPSAQDKVKHSGGEAYTNYEEMLDALKPDAVIVCTTPNLHLPGVRATAMRDISLLFEKPPARTVAE